MKPILGSIKAVFIDIDGTIINSEKEVTPTVMAEIARIRHAYAIDFFFVSSRMPKSIRKISHQLDLDNTIAAYNGALILSEDEPKPIVDLAIEGRHAVQVVLTGSRLNAAYTGLYSYDDWFVRDFDYWTQREINGTKVEPQQASLEGVAIARPIHKVMFRDTAEKIADLSAELKKMDGIAVYTPQPTCLEIINTAASKASSVALITKKFNLPLSEVMAIGDSDSDKEMIRSVGFGIAMGNAHPVVKEIAFDIARTNDEDGVAHILKKYFK
jgi:Cof subfamily protein (haloacid dehalogenase superfamily)